MAGIVRIIPKSVPREIPKSSTKIRDVRTPYKLDLHGYTVQAAYEETRQFLQAARFQKYKHVTIVTGLSGQIRQEFRYWLQNIDYVREVSEINGGGAFKVKFKK
jgi:DNA-nicking Smr family endonuclease